MKSQSHTNNLMHPTTPQHINPRAKQSRIGTQGPCVRRCARVGTQSVAFPSGHAYATGVQRCDTGADVRTVRPYKPHPSHAVLFYTVSMAGTVWDCGAMPARTREVTTTNVETLRATSPAHHAHTQDTRDVARYVSTPRMLLKGISNEPRYTSMNVPRCRQQAN